MQKIEQARWVIAAFTRISWWMAAFLWITELACLPVVLFHHPGALAADVVALSVTALFTLALVIAPKIALSLIDRASKAQATAPHRGGVQA
ncbi:MAG: hypothetical protein OWU84_05810 [Firmicutes bacterium]|nr:hypothetical protein [Bacillota bacterium]